jgi:prepilin-type N-terminal cleavage/methylation domain-containing protein
MQINKSPAKKLSGFTLIELLIVITTLGIISAVALQGQTVQMLCIWPRAQSTGIVAIFDTPDATITYGSNTVTFTFDTNCTVT